MTAAVAGYIVIYERNPVDIAYCERCGLSIQLAAVKGVCPACLCMYEIIPAGAADKILVAWHVKPEGN